MDATPVHCAMEGHSHLYSALVPGSSEARVLHDIMPRDAPLTESREALVRTKLAGRNILLDNPESRRLPKRRRGRPRIPLPKPTDAVVVRAVSEAEPGLRLQDVLGLHRLWAGYMRDVRTASPAAERAQAMLHADYHGAYVRVVQSRVPSRVGLGGVVVQETLRTLVLVRDTAVGGGDKRGYAIVPKAGTVFEVELEMQPGVRESVVRWQLFGDQLVVQSAHRTSRKFKTHASVAMY